MWVLTVFTLAKLRVESSVRQEKWSRHRDKSSEGQRMTDCATTEAPIVREMRGHLERTARGYSGTSVKGRFAYLAKKLGVKVGRVRHYWYGDVRRVEAQEADQIRERAWLAEQERLAQQLRDYEASRREFIDKAPRALARLVPPSLAEAEGHELPLTGAPAGGRRP